MAFDSSIDWNWMYNHLQLCRGIILFLWYDKINEVTTLRRSLLSLSFCMSVCFWAVMSLVAYITPVVIDLHTAIRKHHWAYSQYKHSEILSQCRKRESEISMLSMFTSTFEFIITDTVGSKTNDCTYGLTLAVRNKDSSSCFSSVYTVFVKKTQRRNFTQLMSESKARND